MKLLDMPTTSSKKSPKSPLDADVLFAEARERARGRRRRITVTVAWVAAAGIAIASGFIWLAGQDAGSTSGGRAIAGDTNPARFPATFVAYDGGTPTHPGGIEVINSATGKTIRTLARWSMERQFQLPRGFQLSGDGKTVYYVALASRQYDGTLTSNQENIYSVPVAGGRSVVIAQGVQPSVSPDGTTMAYLPDGDSASDRESVVLLNLVDGSKRPLPIPGVRLAQPVQISWLSDSKHVVIDAFAAQPQSCSAFAWGCPGLAATFRSRAELLNTASGRFTSLPAATLRALHPSAARSVTVLGPSSARDSVRVEITPNQTSQGPIEEVFGVLDVRTGASTLLEKTPATTGIVPLVLLPHSDSGRYYVVQNQNSDRTVTPLLKWSTRSRTGATLIGKSGRTVNSSNNSGGVVS